MSSNTPKTMSSRLMTMKFMQRSAAKNVAASPTTPNGPPSKKKRMSDGSAVASTPGTPDHEILQSALAAEEKKRQEALDKAAQYTGETKWVLSYHDPMDGKREDALDVRQAGFAELDADDSSEDDEEPARPIRMQFGGGVKKKEKPTFEQTSRADDEDDDQSDDQVSSASSDYDSDDPAAELIRETKREMASKKREARSSARQSLGGDGSPRPSPAPRRTVNEDANLGGLTSLSGSGGRKSGLSGGRDMSNMECFRCGQKGHMKDACPNGSAPRGSAGRGRGRGRR